MNRRKLLAPLATLALAFIQPAQAQQGKPFRVRVIHEGGPFNVFVDGLKDGLKDLGLEAGKDVMLEIRDAKGDPAAVEDAARNLEREKVTLIFVISTSATVRVKRATAEVPIVFAVGADPVAAGLVDSFAKPGGRLTGVHYISAELTAKRLELLKEILPKLHKVVTFYDPGNPVALAAVKSARESARQLKLELVERPITSVEYLRLGLKSLEAKDADAYFYTNDAMVTSQAQSIIDMAKAKKLPTMFHEESLVAHGALVSYGASYYQIGRLSAKYAHRVLTGTSPQNLPVESLSRLSLAVNLKTARELGLTIPQSVLLRADKIIE